MAISASHDSEMRTQRCVHVEFQLAAVLAHLVSAYSRALSRPTRRNTAAFHGDIRRPFQVAVDIFLNNGHEHFRVSRSHVILASLEYVPTCRYYGTLMSERRYTHSSLATCRFPIVPSWHPSAAWAEKREARGNCGVAKN